jgi:hypothetical protein
MSSDKLTCYMSILHILARIIPLSTFFLSYKFLVHLRLSAIANSRVSFQYAKFIRNYFTSEQKIISGVELRYAL